MRQYILAAIKKRRLRRIDQSGQTLVEYAIIIALISIVAVVVLQSLGTKVHDLYSTINSRIDQSNSS